jgi:hypothetical protein
MDSPTRRAFLGLGQAAIAAAAISAIGLHFDEAAEAMPAVPDLGPTDKPSEFVTQAQWGGPPPHRRRRRPPPRRRRWVCWWHRGRRHCAWRWR